MQSISQQFRPLLPTLGLDWMERQGLAISIFRSTTTMDRKLLKVNNRVCFVKNVRPSYFFDAIIGCPAYEEVRQASMDGFDLNKYQGKWYEHKFHDWTQFKEVYDTTLDIKVILSPLINMLSLNSHINCCS